MNNAQVKSLLLSIFGLILVINTTNATQCAESSRARRSESSDVNQLDRILTELKQRTTDLQSYQARLEYTFRQPLLESRTLRKGVLYYAKFGKKSKLRLNFTTLKQDDEKEQKYLEQFIFDGIWLTHIDYQIKSVQRRQLAEPNEPVDAFDLASRNLPIIGFTKIEQLREQFNIELLTKLTNESESDIHMRLKTKTDSVYKDDYTYIDFRIDRKTMLPIKIIAITPNEDVYEIMLLQPEINRQITQKVFDFNIPDEFGEPEIIPLNQNNAKK